VDQEFEAALLDWLRYHRSMLIGELVPLTLTFLRQNPALALLPQFEHVLVDEYQDLNRADQALVVETARHGAIAVIGDDNQSIYGLFRYANPEGIRTYPQEYPGTTSYVIEECRRCPPRAQPTGRAACHRKERRPNSLHHGQTSAPSKRYPGRHCAMIFLGQGDHDVVHRRDATTAVCAIGI
jgi:DNA helicase II / ATP-dependent DNA helicase PcrA